ncbi:hypothetical protein QQS21_001487 [Conoideocrella luteorostrata]|uniref:Uncharacterized protein n=1 Tax=Conoideocrella luteorostrata TaxID=1105319 RepID=A0AAJ0CX20_9HYPO|nr:hypothetical protein QQS21_001487 [Conoideocrella luteorostrata]
MAVIKMKCSPEDRKAIIGVSMTARPSTIHLPSGHKGTLFQLVIGLRIIESIRKDAPITICRSGTILAHEDGVDILAQDKSRVISLGLLRVRKARTENNNSPNLKDRNLEFVTIPADGTSVEITHDLSETRLFERSDTIKKQDVRSGETFRMQMDSKYVGTMWWCWGDLDGDLDGKKLHAWQKGINLGDAVKPSVGEIEDEGWVLGEDLAELEFQDQSGWVEIQFECQK